MLSFARPALPCPRPPISPRFSPRPMTGPFPRGQDTGSLGPGHGPVIVAIHPADSAGRVWWQAPITGNGGAAAVILAGGPVAGCGRQICHAGKSIY